MKITWLFIAFVFFLQNWDRSIGLIALTTTGISLLTYSFFILIVPILPPMEIDADESFFSRGLLFWLITPPIAIASMIYLTSFIILFRLYMELKDGKKKQWTRKLETQWITCLKNRHNSIMKFDDLYKCLLFQMFESTTNDELVSMTWDWLILHANG